MDLRDYLNVLRTRWKLVTVCTLLGVLAALGASLLVTPQYQSQATLFMSAANQANDVGSAYSGTLFTQQLSKSLVDAVSGEAVTAGVAEELGNGLTSTDVAAKLSATNPLDTSLITITATDPDPVVAQKIAQSAADHFIAVAVDYTTPDATTTTDGTTTDGTTPGTVEPVITVNTIQPASQPTSPYTPRVKLNLALGFLVGLAIGVGAAVLLETLDTRLKTIEDLDRVTDIPVLATIGYDSSAPKKPLITQLTRHSPRGESFRQLRTNLQFVDVDNPPRSIVVTSAVPGEGKSTTAANLAISIAQAGHLVFLVEGDLRRPKVADYLGLVGGAGLTDVIVGRAGVEQVTQPWGPAGNLWVLPAGTLPPNPAELVGSQAMADVIADLESRAFVIIDAPPLLPVTDGAILSRMAGGALLVVGAGRTRRDQLAGAVASIGNVGGHVLGLVFNRAPTKGPGAHRYGYGYGYSYSYTTKKPKRGDKDALTSSGLSPATPLTRAMPAPAAVGPLPVPTAPEPTTTQLVAPIVDPAQLGAHILDAPEYNANGSSNGNGAHAASNGASSNGVNGTAASNGAAASSGVAPASNGTAPASNGTAPSSNGAAPASNGTAPASNGSAPAPDPTATPNPVYSAPPEPAPRPSFVPAPSPTNARAAAIDVLPTQESADAFITPPPRPAPMRPLQPGEVSGYVVPSNGAHAAPESPNATPPSNGTDAPPA